MKLFDTLRKLGVLRFGATTGVYHNAKDRPLEFQDEGIYNASKDTVTKKEVANAVKPSGVSQKLFVGSAIAAAVFLLLGLTSTFWWFVALLWVVWVALLWRVRSGKLALLWPFSVIFGLLILFSFFFVLMTQSDSGSTSSSKTSTSANKKLTSAQCQPYVQKYNNKVLKLSADGLQGTVGIKIDASNGCKLKGWYNVLLSHNLPLNPYKRDAGGIAYHYTVLLRSPSTTERTDSDGFGELSAVYKNQTTLPGAFDDGTARASLYGNGGPAAETNYFTWGYQIDTVFSEARYKEILEKTKLEIVNGTPFMKEEAMGTGYSWSVNEDEAAVKGEIVKSYTLTISE